jgi:lysophospholipase L1-like esterase
MVPQKPWSIKGIVKRILGYKYLGQESENIKRHKFNNMLREYCRERGKTLFDLEKFETQYPDDTHYVYRRGGLKIPALIPEYTDDGGHPNELGRKIIAKELLKLLIIKN